MSINVRNIDMNEKKIVYLKNLADGQIMEADIYPKNSVGEAKRLIEKYFNLGNNYLDGYPPRLIKKGEKKGTLLDDDNRIFAEFKLTQYATIQFSKIKNRGGNYMI